MSKRRLRYYICSLCEQKTPTYDTLEDMKALFEARNPGKTFTRDKVDLYCDRCYELMQKPLLPGIKPP